MSVKIHGKEYRTVAERVNLFHDENKDAVKSIKTKILFTQEDKVVMRATVTVGDSIYTGHAEEVYGSSRINETSALVVDVVTPPYGSGIITVSWEVDPSVDLNDVKHFEIKGVWGENNNT